jgi:hypothetical protein
MPRPLDAAALRSAFGPDIIFALGNDPTAHGPWEGASVAILEGGPYDLATGGAEARALRARRSGF